MLREKLYRLRKPYNSGMLKVSDLHSIYYEEVGNPNGVPILFVHGGPGSAPSESSRQFFDPKYYCAIIFHQRGAGKSIPSAEIKENTTQFLVEDIEKLRKHLKIDKWILFGGSWGSTLSLIYSINYPQYVSGLILRGIFLGRKEDDEFLYQKGSSYFFPEAFEEFKNFIPQNEQNNMIKAYSKYLNSSNLDIAYQAAYHWAKWELGLITLEPLSDIDKILEDKKSNLELARLENHYFVNHIFLEENFIMNNVDKIKDIKTIIIHGRYDMDCRPSGAYELAMKLNNCSLRIIPKSGHSSREILITKALVKACEEFKEK